MSHVLSIYSPSVIRFSGKLCRTSPCGDFPSHGGTPKSSILVGFSIINHPFGSNPTYGNPTISWEKNTVSCSFSPKIQWIYPRPVPAPPALRTGSATMTLCCDKGWKPKMRSLTPGAANAIKICIYIYIHISHLCMYIYIYHNISYIYGYIPIFFAYLNI